MDVDNTVSAILASYRGYDTMGETTVVFAAMVGVFALIVAGGGAVGGGGTGSESGKGNAREKRRSAKARGKESQ
jgi:hypothetical protein